YEADALVLPGVGAFKDAMDQLHALNFIDSIKENVQAGKPILGICLGLQLFYEKSYEHGEWTGLGLLEGEVVRFDQQLKVPHMGWNQLVEGTNSCFHEVLQKNEYRSEERRVGKECR